MEPPNPDVEDVHVLLDVIPNLVVVYDLDVEAMLVEVLQVDVTQHVDDQVDHVQDDVDGIFVVELLEDDVNDSCEVDVVPVQG